MSTELRLTPAESVKKNGRFALLSTEKRRKNYLHLFDSFGNYCPRQRLSTRTDAYRYCDSNCEYMSLKIHSILEYEYFIVASERFHKFE